MKTKLLLSFFILSTVVKAQVYKNSEASKRIQGASYININSKTQTPDNIRLSADVSINNSSAWLTKALGLTASQNVKLLKEETDILGFTCQRYQSFYKNIPIEGGDYLVHSKGGLIKHANGHFHRESNINATASLNELDAFNKALSYFKADKYIWEERNIIYSERPQGTLVILPLNNTYVLCYKFDVFSVTPNRREFVYIDANNGDVVHTENRIHESDVVGTAVTKYNGVKQITTDSYNGSFRLRESARGTGNGVETYNLKNSTSYGSAVDFTDADNYWNTTTSQDNAAYDAHYGSEMVYDYYKTKFNRNSFDNAGAKLISYVHYSSGYVNAFWNGSFMTYGDGDGSTYTALTSMDIVGHEITHAVTERSAGLVYSYESGALNESFSDIFGVVIDFYSNPGTANFLMGDQISTSGTPFRSMSNPNQFGQPDTYKGTNWYTGGGDNGGVHYNSGVQNYWFYLLTNGGSGTNDIGSVFNVSGIGMDKAAQIAYRTLTSYLTSNSQYADARTHSIQSAIDLFGACSAEEIAVTNAWYAVGIGASYNKSIVADFSSNLNYSCTVPTTVQFTNSSLNATSYLWDFGDGSTSTVANLSHTYTSAGNYTVSLTGYGSGQCGSNSNTKTKPNYIIINNQKSIANFSLSSTSPPLNSNVYFTDLSTNSPTSWLWKFGDGSTSTLQNPSHKYATSGVQNVTLISYACGNSDTIVKSLTVQSAPVISVTPSLLSATINSCNDSISKIFTINNSGGGELTWQLQIPSNSKFISCTAGSGTTSASTSSTISVMFKSTGLNSGAYIANISIASNDPTKPTVLLPCTLAVVGSPKITLNKTCLNYGSLMAGISAKDSVLINNTGCDTLKVSSIVASPSVFAVSPVSGNFAPGKSGYIKVVFAPSAATSYSGSLTIHSNARDTTLCLTGTGTPPPVISVNPGSFNVAISSCNDSLTYPLTINNTGGINLNFNILNASSTASPSCSPSAIGQNTCCGMGIYNVTFNTIKNSTPGTDGSYKDYSSTQKTTVKAGQTYSLSVQTGSLYAENVRVWIDYNNNGIFEGSEQVLADALLGIHTAAVTIPASAKNTSLRMRVASDYSGTTIPGPCTNPYYGQTEDYTLTNGNIISLSASTGTVTSGSSTVVNVKFKSMGLGSGQYISKLLINSNDPATPQVIVPCSLVVVGSPKIVLNKTCLNYGSLMAGTSAKDSVLINNTGCDTLKVSSIVASPSVFTVSPASGNFAPGKSGYVKVIFSPSASTSYSGSLTIHSNTRDTSICLTGTGTPPPVISLNQTALTTTLSCCDSIAKTLKISNTGGVDLNWVISSSGGFSDNVESGINGWTSTGLWHRETAKYSSPKTSWTYNTGSPLYNYDTGANSGALTSKVIDLSLVPSSNVTKLKFKSYYQTEDASTAWDQRWIQISVNGGAFVNFNQLSGETMNSWQLHTLDVSAYNGSKIQLRFFFNSIDNIDNAFWGWSVDDISVDNASGNSFFSLTPQNGTDAPGDSTLVNVKFKSCGLTAGVYTANVIVSSNDPINPMVIVPLTMKIVGPPKITLNKTCLNYGSLMAGTSAKDSVLINNTGCDTLKVSSIVASPSVFTVSSASGNFAPGKSGYVKVIFAPSAATSYSGSLTIHSNARDTTLCLTGTGTPPPVISVNPSSFNVTINSCNDSLTYPLTINNTGGINLNFNILTASSAASPSCSPSNIGQNTCCGMGIYNVTFNTINNSTPGTDGSYKDYSSTQNTTVKAGQTYNLSVQTGSQYVENVRVWIDYNNNGIFEGTEQVLADALLGIHTAAVTIPASAKNASLRMRVASDYSGTTIPGPCTNPYYGQTEDYTLTNGNIISLSASTGTVTSGSSTVVNVKFKSMGFGNGQYTSKLLINSNDPATPQVIVPCSLVVVGSPKITLNKTCLNYGSLMAGTSAKDSVLINNTGCDTLKVSSIVASPSVFAVSPASGNFAPGKLGYIKVVFAPLAATSYSGSLTIHSNTRDTTICLTGTGTPPPVISVNPGSFNVTINSCNDSLTYPLTINNTGGSNLNYSLFGSTIQGGKKSILYSQSFVQGQASNAQAAAWIAFRDQLIPMPYVSLKVNGTNNTTGITLTDPTAIANIAKALKTTTPYSIVIGGNTWKVVTTCGAGASLIVNGGDCSCDAAAANLYVVRPEIANSNWGGINTAVCNAPNQIMSVEFVYGTDWLIPSLSSGTVTPGGSSVVNVKFKSTGLGSGQFTSKLFVNSNDPTTPQVIVPCTLSVVAAPKIVLNKTCLNYGSLMAGTSAKDSVLINNTGCDTLKVSSIVASPSVFTVSPASGNFAPGKSGYIKVVFAPSAATSYTGSLTIHSNTRDTTICLTGTGTPPPVISVNPGSLNVTINSCSDSLIYPLTINNTGGINLNFNILSSSSTASPSCSPASSGQNTCCGIGIYNVTFNTINNSTSGTDGSYKDYSSTQNTTVKAGQTYSLSVQTGSFYSENVRVWIDYNNNGIFEGSEQVLADAFLGIHTAAVTIPASAKNANLRMRVASDYSGNNIPTPCSNPMYGQVEDYTLTNGNIISLSASSGTVTPGSSIVVNVKFKATGLAIGQYTSSLLINSNDPTTPQVMVPCTLSVVKEVLSGIITSTNVSCNGSSNGVATISVSGGCTPYAYSWSTSPIQTGASATGLAPGIYSVSVTDANGSSITSTVVVNQPSPLVVTTTVTNPNCSGENGIISANVSGGTQGYVFNWSNGATTQNISGLSVGNYSVTVTDVNGCSQLASDSITQMVIATTQSNILCNGGKATATANPSGGISPYTYVWKTSPIQTTKIATGLSASNYTVIVTDVNGCTKTATLNITQPSALLNPTPAKTAILCNGGKATATSNPSGGTVPYTYEWSTSPAQTTKTATGLLAGTYTVKVTDANDCSTLATVSITQPAILTADAGPNKTVYYGYTPKSCANLTGSAIGGTTNYSYSWSNGSSSANTQVCPSTSTDYTLTVTDANGCKSIDMVKVCAMDVRCEKGGKNITYNGGGKVVVCHVPGGDLSKREIICIAPSAVEDHLAHGDKLGICGANDNCYDGVAKTSESKLEDGIADSGTHVIAFPNPFNNKTIIEFNVGESSRTFIEIYDMKGSLINKAFDGATMEGQVNRVEVDGTNWDNGIYIAKIVNQNKVQYIKLILTK